MSRLKRCAGGDWGSRKKGKRETALSPPQCLLSVLRWAVMTPILMFHWLPKWLLTVFRWAVMTPVLMFHWLPKWLLTGFRWAAMTPVLMFHRLPEWLLTVFRWAVMTPILMFHWLPEWLLTVFRWAAMTPVLMFHWLLGTVTRHNLWRERRAKAELNWGTSAYLVLTGWVNTLSDQLADKRKHCDLCAI